MAEHSLESKSGADAATAALPEGLLAELAAAASVGDVLDIAATWLPNIVAADRANLTLVTDDDALELFALGGGRAFAVGTLLPTDAALAGQAIADRRTVEITDLHAQDRSGAADLVDLIEQGQSAVLVAPILGGGRCIGTVNLARSTAGSFGEAADRDLTALGLVLGTAVEAQRHESRMRELANTDEVTGVLNRSGLDDASERMWATFVKGRNHFAVVRIEVGYQESDATDHFEDVERAETGDELLRTVATNLTRAVRAADVVARVDRREFTIVLPGLSLEAGRSWAESVRRRIAGSVPGVAASIGVAVSRSCDRSFESVYTRSGLALGAARNRGRDRVVLSVD